MNGFSPGLLAKMKVDMRNMYREKHGLTAKVILLSTFKENKCIFLDFWFAEKIGFAEILLYQKEKK